MKNWRNFYEGFVVNILHQSYSGGEITNNRGILRIWERGEVYTEFWCVTRRYRLENLGVGRRIILKWTLKKQDGVAWTGLIWL